jgi:hypothetical protein
MNANITSLNTIRGTYLGGTGHTPFAWGPPDGYPHEFEYWGGLPLPRWNFAFQLANNSISGATVDLTALLAGATTPAAIADRIDTVIFAGEMPGADKSALVTYLRPSGTATVPSSNQIRDAFGLALASPAFQWH